MFKYHLKNGYEDKIHLVCVLKLSGLTSQVAITFTPQIASTCLLVTAVFDTVISGQ